MENIMYNPLKQRKKHKGFWSGFAGALAGIGGSLLSGSEERSASAKAYDRQKEFYQNRHQWEVKDLEAAGLNPILSALGQPPMPTIQTSKVPDYGASASSALQTKANIDLLEEQKNTESAKAMKEAVDAAIKLKEVDLVGLDIMALVNSLPKTIQGTIKALVGASNNPNSAKDQKIGDDKIKFGVPILDKLKSSGSKYGEKTLWDSLKTAGDNLVPVGIGSTVGRVSSFQVLRNKLRDELKKRPEYKNASPSKKAYMLQLADRKAREMSKGRR
jgi:hypothetical protein